MEVALGCPAPLRAVSASRHGSPGLRDGASLLLRPRMTSLWDPPPPIANAGANADISVDERHFSARKGHFPPVRAFCQLRRLRLAARNHAFVILGRSRSEANCAGPGIHAVTPKPPQRCKLKSRKNSLEAWRTCPRSAHRRRNLLVLLDGQRLDPLMQRLDHLMRRGHGRRRHRFWAGAGGEGCQGKEDGQRFHGAGVRWEVWHNRGGR